MICLPTLVTVPPLLALLALPVMPGPRALPAFSGLLMSATRLTRVLPARLARLTLPVLLVSPALAISAGLPLLPAQCSILSVDGIGGEKQNAKSDY